MRTNAADPTSTTSTTTPRVRVPDDISPEDCCNALREAFVNHGAKFLIDSSNPPDATTQVFLKELFNSLQKNKNFFWKATCQTIEYFFLQLDRIFSEEDQGQTCIDLGIRILHESILWTPLEHLKFRQKELEKRLPATIASTPPTSPTQQIQKERAQEVLTDIDILTTIIPSNTVRPIVETGIRLVAKKACLEAILEAPELFQLSISQTPPPSESTDSAPVTGAATTSLESPFMMQKQTRRLKLSLIACEGALRSVNDRYKKHIQAPKHIRCINKDKNLMWVLQAILSLTILCAIGFAIHSRYFREPGARTWNFFKNSTRSCEDAIAKKLEASLWEMESGHVSEIQALSPSLSSPTTA